MADSPFRVLSKDDIWSAKDLEERDVPVPLWGDGVGVRVRSLSLEQVTQIKTHAQKKNPKTGTMEDDNRLLMAGLLCEGIIEPLFDFNESVRLLTKSSAAVSVIVNAINELSGLTGTAVAEADKSDGDGYEPAVPVFLDAGAEDRNGAGPASPDERA